MDIEGILKQLRQEHTQLEDSIFALERLQASRAQKPGRPPKWLTAVKATMNVRMSRPIKKPAAKEE